MKKSMRRFRDNPKTFFSRDFHGARKENADLFKETMKECERKGSKYFPHTSAH